MLESIIGNTRSAIAFKEISNFQTTPMTGRSNYAGGIYNDTLIMFGGISYTGSPLGVYPTKYTRQNLVTGVVTEQTFSTIFPWCSGVAVDNNLYVMDGYPGNYSDRFYRIQIEGSGTPVTLATLPAPLRHSSVCAHYKGKIYRLGGYVATGPEYITNKAHVYDIATNTWKDLPDMPYMVNGTTAFATNDKVYVAFGWTGSVSKNSNWFMVYDIEANIWTTEVIFGGLRISWAPGCLVGGSYFQLIAVAAPTRSAVIQFSTANLKMPYNQYNTVNAPLVYGANAYYDSKRGDIIVPGGSSIGPGAPNYETNPKNNFYQKIPLSTVTSL